MPGTDWLRLEHDPALSMLTGSSPELLDQFRASFKFQNPDYDESKAVQADSQGAQYTVSEWIEFFFDGAEDDLSIPTGLYFAVKRWCDERNVELRMKGDWESIPWFKSYTGPIPPTVNPDVIPGITLRDYQVGAAEVALLDRRGVLEIATGGGKTEVAIAIILTLGTPKSIWLVPDVKAGKNALMRLQARGLDAGLLGGGKKKLDCDVLVAVVNSAFNAVARNDTEIQEEWFEKAEVFIIDECHHQATAVTWQAVAASIKAEYRIGLSGTPFKDDKVRKDPAILDIYDSWLIGFTGPSLVYLPPKELIKRGALSPGVFVSWPAAKPPENIYRLDFWPKVYLKGITENDPRNRQICQLAANLSKMGRKPLVSIEKLEHGRDLQRGIIRRHGVPAACSFGSGVTYLPVEVAEAIGAEWEYSPIYETKSKIVKGKRKKVQEKVGEEKDIVLVKDDVDVENLLLEGRIGAIIGSRIFDEAVDIPWVTDLINAAGGKASQRLRQKIGRILRCHAGKNIAWFWDPWDTCHPYLLSHSKKRWQIAVDEEYILIQDWNWSTPLLTYDLERLGIGDVDVKMKEITVGVSMTIPIPSQPGYTSIKPVIVLKADIEDGDDVNVAAYQLHAQGLALWLQESARQAQWAQYSADHGPDVALQAYLKQFETTTEGGEKK